MPGLQKKGPQGTRDNSGEKRGMDRECLGARVEGDTEGWKGSERGGKGRREREGERKEKRVMGEKE